jgi:aerobic-type carbon monoxide dehydrogenase small subunit (CoxS/CutS family)
VLREEFWVTTLEGLLDDQGRRALGRACVETGAMQCGHRTPGMLVAATAL